MNQGSELDTRKWKGYNIVMKIKGINKVVVLMGGTSSEKTISLRSGRNVADSLKLSGYEVIEIDPEFQPLPAKMDFVFIALHGEGGEDGKIQAKLDKLGVPYSGSGVISSVLSFDKLLTKKLLSLYGIPSADFCLLNAEKDVKKITSFPAVIKPALEGSSIGVVIVDNESQALKAFKSLKDKFTHLFAETFISGKEVTVSIVGSKVLPILELRPKNRFYDFEAKYTKGMTDFILPAELSKQDELLVKEIAKKAYDAVGCRGAARVDMIIDSKKGPFVLEINTSPGMTETSDLPAQAKAAGIEFDQLLELIMKNSL